MIDEKFVIAKSARINDGATLKGESQRKLKGPKPGMQGTGGTNFGKTLPPHNQHHHHEGAF